MPKSNQTELNTCIVAELQDLEIYLGLDRILFLSTNYSKASIRRRSESLAKRSILEQEFCLYRGRLWRACGNIKPNNKNIGSAVYISTALDDHGPIC
jgi:hypothetical protein